MVKPVKLAPRSDFNDTHEIYEGRTALAIGFGIDADGKYKHRMVLER